MVKINSILLSGVRGAKNEIMLELGGRSALIYGDNGSGKSSITDAIEWFYYDRVEHLSDEEIGRKGLEGLRNITLEADESAHVALSLSERKYSATKYLSLISKKLKSSHSKEDKAFLEYIYNSQQENLILRYRDLASFVLASKTDKLRALSDIIGYGKISDTRDVLKSTYNSICRDLKTKSFPEQISLQQSQIIEQLGQNVTSDEQFIEIVKTLISPWGLTEDIDTVDDVTPTLQKIGKPDNASEIKREEFFSKLSEVLVTVPATIDDLEQQYSDFSQKFNDIISNQEKLRNLLLERLLNIAGDLLKDDAYDIDACPVCLQEQDRKALAASVDSRLDELTEVKLEQAQLRELADAIHNRATEITDILGRFSNDEQIGLPGSELYRDGLAELIKVINNLVKSVNILPKANAALPSSDALKFDRARLEEVTAACRQQLQSARDALKTDPRWEAYTKINVANHAYSTIKRLQQEQESFELQRDTLEIVCREFIDAQKKSLNIFLTTFSDNINEIYQYLNPNENVGNIRLIPLEKGDELIGITFELDFSSEKSVSPPHKFLSESHLNCLGIAFFLTSVKAFNNTNKFLILDDLISSFDAAHRKRFADLLVEKYSDFQIVLLTHEMPWFQIVRNLVRGRDWSIASVKHSDREGTHLDASPRELRERIEAKIQARDEEELGNLARKYLESLLKNISLHLEVKVAFRFNDINEDRMSPELLNEIIATLNRRKCVEINNDPIFARLLRSIFIGNKDSHDSAYTPSFADAQAFWDDVIALEALLYCSSCSSYVSVRYLDSITKKVRCRCGEISYSWKA